MTFYVYENWTADNKAVIHRGDFGNCNEGQGCHQIIHGNKNGQWLGPFSSLTITQKAANSTGRPVRRHRCI